MEGESGVVLDLSSEFATRVHVASHHEHRPDNGLERCDSHDGERALAASTTVRLKGPSSPRGMR
jgi:hypothetical protein